MTLEGPPEGWQVTIADAPKVRAHLAAMRDRARAAALELDALAADFATATEEYERLAADATLAGNPPPKRPARLDAMEKTVREKSKTVALLAERLDATTRGAAGALFRALGDVERDLETRARERMQDARDNLEGALRYFAYVHSRADVLDLLGPKGHALFPLSDVSDTGGMLHGAYQISLGRSMAGTPDEALGRLCTTCGNAVRIMSDLEAQGAPFEQPAPVNPAPAEAPTQVGATE